MVDKTSLKDQLYVLLKEAILNHDIDSDRIYSVQWLADYFDVSRTPVREATLQLAQENFIVILPNRGIKVKPMTVEEIKEIIQMRTAIECYCTAVLASSHKEPAAQRVISRLEQLVEENDSTKNVNSFVLNDTEFHRSIVVYTGNRQFLNIYNNMVARINLFSSDVMKTKNRHQAASEEHRDILRTIQQGEPESAYKSSMRHLDIIKELLISRYWSHHE